VHLLHVTQTTLEPVTLAILAFGFLALVVVDAPRFLVVKGKYSPTLPSSKIFQVWFLYFPSMMVPLCYESIFGSELHEVCVFLKFF
jgi:hypothetical protein